MVMLAEYGSLSLKDVLAPAIEMADGYPIEASAVKQINRYRHEILKWPHSKAVFLPHAGKAPVVGQVFRQRDLKETLEKLVATEQSARADGLDRKAAIYAGLRSFLSWRYRRGAGSLDPGTGWPDYPGGSGRLAGIH